ncbi:MAG: YncE family protein [Nitrososphaerales archaeon]
MRYQNLVLSLLLVALISSVSVSGWLYSRQTLTMTTTVTNTNNFGVTVVVPSTVTSAVGEPTTLTETITKFAFATDYATTSLYVVPPINDVLITNISVYGDTWDIGVNPDTNLIYSVGPFSNINVIDGSTNQAFRTIHPSNLSTFDTYHVAVNVRTNKIYAGNSIIDGNTNTLEGYLSDNISDVAVDSNTDTIYATSPDFAPPGNSSLLIFNGETNVLVGRINLNAPIPIGIAVDSNTHIVYLAVCAQYFVCTPSYVYAINGTSETIVSRILIGSSSAFDIPSALAVDPARNMLYVTTSQLVSINLTLDQVVQKISLSGYDIQCKGVAVNEAANEIYVTSSSIGNSSTFFILNGANYAVMNAYVDNGGPQGVAFNPTNSEIYLANAQTNTVLALISTSYLLP